MCKRRSVVILVAGLMLPPAACPAGGRADAPAEGVVRGDLGRRLNQYLTRLSPFGFSGVVLVAKDNRVVLSKGYGLTDRERNLPMTAETVVPVGSITKQFTAAAILKLEMQGKLSVQDPLGRFFTDVPKDKAGITLHHLLTHGAGLESDYGDTDFEAVSRDELVRRVFRGKLRGEPGRRFHYSNAGYSLLGAVVELVSGRPYEAYLHEHLFKPAGMTRTGYRLPGWRAGEVAQGYRSGRRWGTILERPWAADGPHWNLRANGGIHSTAGDMYRWHQALEGEAVLSRAAKDKLFAPHLAEGNPALSYGYGWSIAKTPRGTKVVMHNGGNGVYAADFRRYVDEGVVYFVASNVAEFSAVEVSPLLAGAIFGAQVALPPAVSSLPRATLAKYAGRYQLPSGAAFDVAVRDGGLRVTGRGQDAVTLLLTGGVADAKRFQEVNARTGAVVAAAAKGDYRPLHQAFGGRLSLEQVQAVETDARKQMEGKHGAYQSYAVLGTAPEGDRHVTLVRLNFARGGVLVRYAWRGKTLVGLRVEREGSPGPLFLPQAEASFVSFRLTPPSGALPASVRLRFQTTPDSTVRGLTIGDPGTTAQRVSER
jgi:CubicO group peptidase (beta-lactamase class C family)